MTPETHFITVNTDDITARLEILADGIAFCAPVTYRGVVICDKGCWRYGVAHTDTHLIHEALSDCSNGLFSAAGEPTLGVHERLRQARAAA